MKRSIFILISLLFAISATAQVKQEVIASAGGYNTASGLSISWTLGETIIPTFKNGDLVLTHGFQSQLIITTVEENLDVMVNLKIFPNPASDIVNIQFETPVETEIIVYLLDSQGKLVKKDIIESSMTQKQINMQDLAGGIYYIKLVKDKLINVYKVVKL
jgi:hypothetical protein